MAALEQIELEAYRGRIVGDIKALIERYRAIFDWDVPDIDQNLADRMILMEVRKALDDMERDFAREAK